jgi:hypothetical protein
MSNQEKIQLTIYLPMEIRAKLQALAAKQMLEQPQKNFSAASIATSILIEYLTLKEQEKRIRSLTEN